MGRPAHRTPWTSPQAQREAPQAQATETQPPQTPPDWLSTCSPLSSCPGGRPGARSRFITLRRSLPGALVEGGATVGGVDDDAIRSLVTRLARAHPSGGTVIERAAVMAAGADSQEVMTWILAHGGKPEAAAVTSTRHGLHGSRLHTSGGSERQVPSRFVLPAGALD